MSRRACKFVACCCVCAAVARAMRQQREFDAAASTTATRSDTKNRNLNVFQHFTPSPVNAPPSWKLTNSPSVAPLTEIPIVEVRMNPVRISFVVQEPVVDESLVEEQLTAFVTVVVEQGVQDYGEKYQRSSVDVTVASSDVRSERRLLSEQQQQQQQQQQVLVDVLVATYFFQGGDPHPTSRQLTGRIELYFLSGSGYDDLETVLVSSRTGITSISNLQVSFLEYNTAAGAEGSQSVEIGDSTSNPSLVLGLIAACLLLTFSVGGTMLACWKVSKGQRAMRYGSL